MNVVAVYLLHTILLWSGIAFAAVGVFRFVTGARSLALRWAIFAFVLLAAGLLFRPASDPANSFRLPLVWWVAPVAGWLMAAGAVFAGMRAASAWAEAGPEARTRLWRQSAFGGVLAVVAGYFWSREGFESRWLQGGIPLGWGSGLALTALLAAAVLAMAAIGQSARRADRLRKFSTHVTLLAGCVVFGLPFFWLLLTSFKEDIDMSNKDGLVWITRVTETAPHFDPDDPIVEAEFQGQTVQGSIIEKNPDGSAKVDVFRPGSMRGMTFVAPAPLKIVPKQALVVSFEKDGAKLEAKTVRDLGDGGKDVEVIRPPGRKGEKHRLGPDEFELVRHVGLRTQNYSDALEFLPPETAMGLVYLRNSLLLAILTVIGTLLSSSIVAYAFARLRFPGKDSLFAILLATMALPAAVTMLPTFLIFRWLGWVDTLLPLWVPAFLGSAFNIFLLRQFFATIPLELEDAAKIDGCGYLATFWRVMAPQIQPALAFVAVTTAMQSWNNFMGPLIYVNSPEKMTIAYAVQLFKGDRVGEPGLLMAFATMGMAPILLLFLLTQKYFVENVSLSGLGGR